VTVSQRKAVPAIAELELALEIGAPEVVWRGAGRQRRAGRPMPRPSRDLDQAVPVEHGVDRALGRNADVAVQSADQELAGGRSLCSELLPQRPTCRDNASQSAFSGRRSSRSAYPASASLRTVQSQPPRRRNSLSGLTSAPGDCLYGRDRGHRNYRRCFCVDGDGHRPITALGPGLFAVTRGVAV
jgi:hypothetical protein